MFLIPLPLHLQKEIFVVWASFPKLWVCHHLYLGPIQKAGLSSIRALTKRVLRKTERPLRIANHEHKERIHITVKERTQAIARKAKPTSGLKMW